MTQALPAMTGAELQTTREFLGIDRRWLADRMVINDRRLARMEAGQESIPDAVVGELDDILSETNETVRELTALYRRQVKASDATGVAITTFRMDSTYSGEDMDPSVQTKIRDLKASIEDLEANLRRVDAYNWGMQLVDKRAALRRLTAEYRRKTEGDYADPDYDAAEADRQIDALQSRVAFLERNLTQRGALNWAVDLAEKRSELSRTQYPSRWHRMLCARVANAVPGLVVAYR